MAIWKQIVKNHPELLTDEADRLYEELIPEQSNEDVKQQLTRYREWLRRCRVVGVDVACLRIESMLVVGELNNQALSEIEIGNYVNAESFLMRAAEELSKVDEAEGPELVDTLYFTGVLHLKMANYEAAETELRQAIASHRRIYGRENEQLAAMIGVLAEVYRETEDYASAMPLYDEDLDISQRLKGETDPGVATSLHNKGLLYFDLGDYAKAQQFLEQALEIRELALESDSPELAASFNCLGELHKKYLKYLGSRLQGEGENICSRSWPGPCRR